MRNAKRAVLALAALVAMSVGACASAGTASYSVRALPPENQADKEAWYFDLVVEPGQRQVLQALVINMEDEEIQVAVEANTASTNCDGVIVFESECERDPSMAVAFSEIIVPAEPVVIVPPNGQALVDFHLAVPDQPFCGEIYGGLLFTKLEEEDATSRAVISSVCRYAVGARLTQGEVGAPAFELSGAEMDMGDAPAIIVCLRNPSARLARGIGLRIELFPLSGDAPALTFERDDIDMAPNSAAPYRLELFGDDMPEAGAYRMEAELEYEGHAWTFVTSLNVR